jgi:hypothetical protein
MFHVLVMLKSAIALNVYPPQKVKNKKKCFLNFLHLLNILFSGVPVSTQWEASGYYYPGKIFQMFSYFEPNNFVSI